MTSRKHDTTEAAPRRTGRLGQPTERQQARRATAFGIGGALVIVILLAVAGFLYLRPPGRVLITAQMSETGQIRTGDDVRVAGISVGTVDKLRLTPEYVEVKLRIKDSVFIGDAASISVRMLTAVGGHYLSINPAGTKPLGSAVIPAERVHLPYSLLETFQLGASEVGQLGSDSIAETLDQLDTAITNNPNSLRDSVTTVAAMIDNLKTQQDDIGASLKVANEYATAVNASGSVLVEAMGKYAQIIAAMKLRLQYLHATLGQTAEVVARLKPLMVVISRDFDPLLLQVDEILREFQPLIEQFQPTIDAAMELIERLTSTVADDGTIVVDNAGIPLATELCIPIPGVVC